MVLMMAVLDACYCGLMLVDDDGGDDDYGDDLCLL